jgi:hypothetical protein
VHRDGKPGDDARLRSTGCGRRLVDQGRDVRLDGLGVSHPEDRSVGELTGDTQQSRGQRGDHHAHGLRQCARDRDVDAEVLAVD